MIAQALNELASEVGCEFAGFEAACLIFHEKDPEAQVRLMHDQIEVLVKLVRINPEVKWILKEFPNVILR
jgi:hypothetical protein